MTSRSSLPAEKRTVFGRKVKSLRRQNILPANIFGKKVKSLAVQVGYKDFDKIYQQAGETNLVDITLTKDKPRPTLITNVHLDPITSNYLHADFHQVDLTEKVTADIPVETTGEAPAVKEKEGVLVVAINEIEVEALPTNLPDKFEVDLSILKDIGDTITVADLKVDSKVELKIDKDTTIALIQAQKEEEEPEAPAVEATEGEEGAGAEAAEGDEKEGDKKEAESTDKKEDSTETEKKDEKTSKSEEKQSGGDKKEK